MAIKLNFLQKFVLANRILRAVNQGKEIFEKNRDLSEKLERAILNLKADFEVIAALVPAFKPVIADVVALIEKAFGKCEKK